MRINIWTIFPEFFEDTLATSILGRAAEDGLVEYRVVDIRDYALDRHRTVDDEPFGGGAGMVMKPEPFFEARDALKPEGPVAMLTPRGAVFNHATAVRFSLAESSRFCADATRAWTSGWPRRSRPRSCRSATTS